MKRPSHPLSTALQPRPVTHRMTAAGLVILVQMMVAWALVGGLAVQLSQPFGPLKYIAVDDPVKPVPPPPVPRIRDVSPPEVMPPIVSLNPDPAPDSLTASTPQPQPPVIAVKPPTSSVVPAASDRAASAITATQTIPPYPAVALRLGAEGTVTMRLTVLADGTVGKADIVTSSGRHDLDETAQQWIVAHWTYRPALKSGAPAPSQVLAAVRFTLKDAP